MTPAESVIFGAYPSANVEGTELSVGLSVSGFAPLDDRVVRVVIGAGASSATTSPANTLRIAGGPVSAVMSVTREYRGLFPI